MPESVLEGVYVGKAVVNTEALKFDGAPHGGTRVIVGNDEAGTAIDCPAESGWSTVGTRDYTLHQIAYHIRSGRLYLPRLWMSLEIPVIELRDIASIGPSHLQIRGGQPSSKEMTTSYSGPFNVREYHTGCIYPALWNNDQQKQRQMVIPPDASLEPRPDYNDKQVRRVWESATRLHMNIEARTTSQCLLAAYVRDPVVGGTAWPSVIIDSEYEKILAVWCNSTLGILCRWDMSNRQQKGRVRVSRSTILDFPVLDVRNLSKKQHQQFNTIFDEFAERRFDRIMNLWKDPVRIEMDDSMLEVLGVEVDLDEIRKRLCAEPSVNGGKVPLDLAAEHT